MLRFHPLPRLGTLVIQHNRHSQGATHEASMVCIRARGSGRIGWVQALRGRSAASACPGLLHPPATVLSMPARNDTRMHSVSAAPTGRANDLRTTGADRRRPIVAASNTAPHKPPRLPPRRSGLSPRPPSVDKRFGSAKNGGCAKLRGAGFLPVKNRGREGRAPWIDAKSGTVPNMRPSLIASPVLQSAAHDGAAA
jgi:hypothetical protein